MCGLFLVLTGTIIRVNEFSNSLRHCWRRLAPVFFAVLVLPVSAAEKNPVLAASRAIEAATFTLLGEQFGFEERLSSPDSDRIVVFMSLAHGSKVIIDNVILKIDGKPVQNYAYSATELLTFQQRSVQLLYAGRIEPGQHSLRLEVKTMQGLVKPMKDYVFTKEDTPKFVDIQLSGYQAREIFVVDW